MPSLLRVQRAVTWPATQIKAPWAPSSFFSVAGTAGSARLITEASRVRLPGPLPTGDVQGTSGSYKAAWQGAIPWSPTIFVGEGKRCAAGLWPPSLEGSTPSSHPKLLGRRVADCSPASEAGKRGFESHRPNHLAGAWCLTASTRALGARCPGSNPGAPTISMRVSTTGSAAGSDPAHEGSSPSPAAIPFRLSSTGRAPGC